VKPEEPLLSGQKAKAITMNRNQHKDEAASAAAAPASATGQPDAACEDAKLVVTAGDAGQRLDRFLARRFAQLSRTRLQVLIRTGRVSLLQQAMSDTAGAASTAAGLGQRVVSDPGAKLHEGEVYGIDMPPLEPAEPLPEQMQLAIAFEDDHLIVVNKPAGLVVHPAPGHGCGTLVNGLLAHCGDSLSGIGGVRRPGIVHRLDKDTSGLLVVAKTDAAHQGLSQQFQAHGRDGRLSRRYRALVWGVPAPALGVINVPLGRSGSNRLKIAVMREGQGRPAVTRYKTLAGYCNGDGRPLVALLDCELETGRTHQIRVHLAHLRHPLLGDKIYAAGFAASTSKLNGRQFAALRQLGRQALHAAHLGFEHPATGERLSFEAAPPADMQALIDAFSTQSKKNM